VNKRTSTFLGATLLLVGGTAAWAQLPPPSDLPFVAEVSARYWYSTGKINFGFANGNPLFGNPTSTLDWSKLSANTGELHARLTHDSGFFLKGSIGAGQIGNGQIIDRDFFTGQISFSDTYSRTSGDRLRYGIIDAGYALQTATGHRIGAFAGYMYWKEKVTAFGVRCNPDDVGGALCGAPGTVLVPFDVMALGYEPTWHALRIGADAKYQITSKLSVSGEVAWIPWANLRNLDSHFLRADLAPSPNIISTSSAGRGVTAEAFINYEIFPNIEISAGLRYWALSANSGDVVFYPAGGGVSQPFPLGRFDQQRWGTILQLKGTF
jgi:outer membrane protease